MSSVDRPRLAPLALAFALGVLGAASLAGCNGSSPPSGSPTSPSPQPLPVPRVLRVAKTGSGTGTVTSTDLTIDCGERCQATFLATTSVTLQALPDAGSGFVRWEGDPDCADGVVSTMADVSCTAVFETPRVVTVSTIGGGSGSVTSPDSAISCPPVCQDTLFGTVPVTLVAVPSVGSLFAGFAGDPDCADGMLSTTADIACTARFEPVSTLGVTGFLAFGDSFTLGIVSLPSLNGFRLTGTPESYPSQLLGLLGASYPNQTFMMDNRGVSGERAEDGVLRLPMVLAEVGASVGAMLLIHGVNDLEAFRMAGIPKIAADVDSMVQQAQAMGLPVFLGNLPPQRPTVNKGRREVAPLVPLLNAEYARIAATRGVTLVDLFRGVDLALIGRDGLHPTAAGYVRIAELFFAAIAAAFDMPTVITGGDTGTGSGGAGGGTGSGGSGGTGSGGTGSGGGGGGTGSGSGGTTIAPPAGSPAPAPWQMRWKRRLGQPR